MNITFLIIIVLFVVTAYLLQNLLKVKTSRLYRLLWYSEMAISLIFIEAILVISGLIRYTPHLYAISFPVKFLVVPLLILIGLYSHQYRTIPVFLRRGIFYPALLSFLVLLPLYSIDAPEKLTLIEKPAISIIVNLWALAALHLFCMVRFYRIWRKQADQKSIWPITVGIACFIVMQFEAALTLRKTYLLDMVSVIPVAVGLFFFHSYLRRKSNGSTDDLLSRIKDLMEDKKLYLKPDLSLRIVSDHLHQTPNEISRTINTGLSKSFNEFINEYRVNEVIQLMKDKANDKFTLEAISKLAGFNSTTAFNKNFKSVTGKTPREYKLLTKS